jgi:hypothetical protein
VDGPADRAPIIPKRPAPRRNRRSAWVFDPRVTSGKVHRSPSAVGFKEVLLFERNQVIEPGRGGAMDPRNSNTPPGDVVCDLGCGDGGMLLAAANNFGRPDDVYQPITAFGSSLSTIRSGCVGALGMHSLGAATQRT